MPNYLVRPTFYPAELSMSSNPIKIVDFGESFLSNDIPDTLHTSLPVRALKTIFGEKLDCRVDLWSMGCMASSNLSRNLRKSSQFSVAFRAHSRPTAVRQLYDNAHDPCPPNAGDGEGRTSGPLATNMARHEQCIAWGDVRLYASRVAGGNLP